LTNDKVLAIGEIGLDYNWDKVGNFVSGNEARKLQQKWFRKQIDLARSMNLPVCIHSRDAEADTVRIFKEYDELSGVIHCYAYGTQTAKIALDKGLYLGVGGTSTYSRNEELRDVIKMCPIDRILLETDCPYLSPEPVRRETNNSSLITYVIDNICSLKKMSREDVIRKTNENAYRLFKFGGSMSMAND
jgi:TatD DNase family protein